MFEQTEDCEKNTIAHSLLRDTFTWEDLSKSLNQSATFGGARLPHFILNSIRGRMAKHTLLRYDEFIVRDQ